MKKITFLFVMLSIALSGFAQKRLVNRAEDVLNGELTEANLRSAEADIEKAMIDSTTANLARTYYVAAKIYCKFFEEEEKKRLLGQETNQRIRDKYVVKAIDAYLKTAELDELPDEKGKVKPKYTKELKTNLENYSRQLILEGSNNYNEGVKNDNADDFVKAIELWEKYLEAPSYPLLKSSGLEKDSLYNEIKFYVVNAANRVGMKHKAIKYMEELKDAGYQEQNMYQWLYEEYKTAGDTAAFVKTLLDGLKRFPNDKFLVGNLINYYIHASKLDDAVTYLDDAIAKDPGNAQYYAVKGNILLNGKQDFDGAIKLFLKTEELDPSSFLAQTGLGLTYVARGQDISNKANAIKDNQLYLNEIKRAKEEFAKAIPYLEKARTLQPADVDNLNVLKALYLRLERGADYEKIDAEIKILNGQ